MVEKSKKLVYNQNYVRLERGVAMKRLFASVICLAMLVGCGAQDEGEVSSTVSRLPSSSAISASSEIIPSVNDYSERTYRVNDIKDYLLESQRCMFSREGLSFDQAGASLSFNADCEGDVKVAIYATPYGSDTEKRYYTVFVDGKVTNRVNATVEGSKSIEITVAKDLPRGKHEIRIHRATPTEYGVEVVKSITMSGVPDAKPERKKLIIEFVGDSITAGLDIFDNAGDKWDKPEFSDSTQTYAFFTAENLDAEFSSICCGGLPFVVPYGRLHVKERYIRANPWSIEQFYFERSADIVVINLGTNDYGREIKNNDLTESQVAERAVDLIKFIQLKNPKAKIVWAYGMLGNMGEQTLKGAVERAGGAEKGVYYCPMPSNLAGDSGHPNVASHKNAAEVLTNFIKQNVV